MILVEAAKEIVEQYEIQKDNEKKQAMFMVLV